MEPLVSICIPAYNNAAYIKDTIDSILSQTYKNLELVIVDDKSKDDTVAVIKSIPDERIRLYENEKNLGMSGNWNHCLELCKGEYIKLICADDMLAPDAIEKEARALTEHPDVQRMVPQIPHERCGERKEDCEKRVLFPELFRRAAREHVPEECAG